MSKKGVVIEEINFIIQGRKDIDAKEISSIAISKYSQLRSAKLTECNKFSSVQEFALWWASQFVSQDGRCCYCKTKISDIQKLIQANLLKTRRVGRNGSGKRGPQFEVERMDSSSNEYSSENCKLACYYCNNDKSYIFPSGDYEQFLAKSKKEYFELLLRKLKRTDWEPAI